jgi:hypothetical protein
MVSDRGSGSEPPGEDPKSDKTDRQDQSRREPGAAEQARPGPLEDVRPERVPVLRFTERRIEQCTEDLRAQEANYESKVREKRTEANFTAALILERRAVLGEALGKDPTADRDEAEARLWVALANSDDRGVAPRVGPICQAALAGYSVRRGEWRQAIERLDSAL